MKALSLTQPWATLVVIGAKRLETRSWCTNYRGPLLIHAAQRTSSANMDLCLTDPLFQAALVKAGIKEYWRLPLGALLGRVNLVACWEVLGDGSLSKPGFIMPPPGDPELSFGDYSEGRWVWQLESPVKFTDPIPWRGSQGLFEVPDKVVLGR